MLFRSWSAKCSSCANYSGSQVDCGYCRVWSAVIPQDSRLTNDCPHWTSREALKPVPVALGS
jgi:hypothetical protein